MMRDIRGLHLIRWFFSVGSDERVVFWMYAIDDEECSVILLDPTVVSFIFVCTDYHLHMSTLTAIAAATKTTITVIDAEMNRPFLFNFDFLFENENVS